MRNSHIRVLFLVRFGVHSSRGRVYVYQAVFVLLGTRSSPIAAALADPCEILPFNIRAKGLVINSTVVTVALVFNQYVRLNSTDLPVTVACS